MYSPAFHYHRASSLSEAHQLIAAHPGAKVLAGGHSLIPALKLRLSSVPTVIDIGRVAELRGISRLSDGIRIGALTTHAAVAESQDLRVEAPALTDAASHVGDPAVRNRGTIGGNIAHADPASDLPTALVALKARVLAVSARGERTISADDFFTGIMSTALGEDEIIAAVIIPNDDGNRTSAYVKFPHPASRYAVIGAAAALTMSGNTCRGARIAIGGLVPHARRLPAVEQAVVGSSVDARGFENARTKIATDLGSDVTGDIYASADYRAAMAPIYVARALAAAAGRRGGA